MSSKTLKSNFHMMAPILSNLINKCLTEGTFPTPLKISRIIPVYKDSDPLQPSNYRPISNLLAFAKIFEMIMFDRIMNFVTKFNIINENQYGFLKNSNTICAATSIINHLQTKLDQNQNFIGACIFIDLRKAFDTVPHTLLFNKLEKLGIRGTFLQVIIHI